jgi:hypothetical protein
MADELIIKNISSTKFADANLNDVGVTIAASSQITVKATQYLLWAASAVGGDANTDVTSGAIVVNDGVDDLSVTDGLAHLKFLGHTASTRFRINALTGTKQFTAKTAQGAIEESFPRVTGNAGGLTLDAVRNINFTNGTVTQVDANSIDVPIGGSDLDVQEDDVSINSATTALNFEGGAVTSVVDEGAGKTTVTIGGAPPEPLQGRSFLVPFFNNGNTSNKWLFHIPTNEATDNLPYVEAFDVEVFGILFSNKNPAVDCDAEFYVNGINNPAKVYTFQVRGFENQWLTTTTNFWSMVAGDRLSIFIKKVGQSAPSSVEIDLWFRITSTVGTSGGNNP